MEKSVPQNCVTELAFEAALQYNDPYNTIDLLVTFLPKVGPPIKVPAFWAGGKTFKVRFSSPEAGLYKYKTECSMPGDAGLHNVEGLLEVTPYTGNNYLIKNGRIRVAQDRMHFEHHNGTPFFWLGDTWWMGMTSRLDFTVGFKQLVADRLAKGFNVIQLVVGPMPDMAYPDDRNANEGGMPLSPDMETINPAFFDYCDQKIDYLVRAGIVPCIVGMWGYHLKEMTVERAQRYWRYLIARYCAYPVFWCAAGEAAMPWYLSGTPQQDTEFLRKGWSVVAAHIREKDPYRNPVTIHPRKFSREDVDKPNYLDFELIQVGHGDMDSLPITIDAVRKAISTVPVMPVVMAELNYEGILGKCWRHVQRLGFWHSVLNGAAGFTYGANGIWQMNTQDRPFGPSPHGNTWGNVPWQRASQRPGSVHVGVGAKFMRQFPFWELRPAPSIEGAAANDNNPNTPIAAGIPKRLRIIYVPQLWGQPVVEGIERGVQWKAFYFDPTTGQQHDLGAARPGLAGDWEAPFAPEVHDWLIVLIAQDNPVV